MDVAHVIERGGKVGSHKMASDKPLQHRLVESNNGRIRRACNPKRTHSGLAGLAPQNYGNRSTKNQKLNNLHAGILKGAGPIAHISGLHFDRMSGKTRTGTKASVPVHAHGKPEDQAFPSIRRPPGKLLHGVHADLR